MASRCFRKELRRVILAFATRTASALVRFFLGWGALFDPPPVGDTGVVIFEARSTGCVFMGPVTGIFDNSIWAGLFKRPIYSEHLFSSDQSAPLLGSGAVVFGGFSEQAMSLTRQNPEEAEL
jgi:hypothetical protein